MFPVIGITRQNQFTKIILSATKSNSLEYLITSNMDNNCLLSQDGIVKVNIVFFSHCKLAHLAKEDCNFLSNNFDQE